MKAMLAAAVFGGVTTFGSAGVFTADRTIPLGNIEGRIDHLAIDSAGARLFVAAPGNNTVEVVDLHARRVTRSLSGFDEPQGIAFVPATKRLFVANGGDGAVRVLDATSFAVVGTVPLAGDADNVRVDPAAGQVVVGYGSGGLAVIDGTTLAVVRDIPLGAHPESFQLEPNGPRVFVNLPQAHAVAVVDRASGRSLARWALGEFAANFPLAFDATHQRVFVACRSPARLLVYDAGSGRRVAEVPLHGDCDDLFYDATRQQLYAACGEGFLDTIAASGADTYAVRESLPTVAKARTGLFAGDAFYLAVPRRGNEPAELRVYRLSR